MAARLHKIQHDQRTKDGIRATQYLKFLESVALGKKRKLSPQTATRIAAAKVALPFLIPTLQSVEATVHDERDNADPMALYSQMIAALAANPALLDRLIAAVHAHRATNAQLVADVPQSGK